MSNAVTVTDEEAEFICNMCCEFTKTLDKLAADFFRDAVPNTKLGRGLLSLYLDILPATGPAWALARLQRIAPWAFHDPSFPHIVSGATAAFQDREATDWATYMQARMDRYWHKQLKPAIKRHDKEQKSSRNKADLPGLPAGTTAH